MKRTIKIRGFIGKNGQIQVGLFEDESLKDRTDLGLLSECFMEDNPIREIVIETEIDVDEIFKDTIIKGKTKVISEELT